MYTELLTAASTISTFPTNQQAPTKLINGVRTFLVQLRLRATVTLAGGPATTINNRGSLLAMFDRSGLNENGKRYISADTRSLGILSQMQSPRVIDHGSVRLTSLANGATNLEENILLYFGSNLQINPADTAYLERIVRNDLSAFVMSRGTNAAGFLVTTPGTAVLSNISVTVVQRYDTDRADRVDFLPVFETYEFPVSGTSTNFPMEIKTSRYIRAMLFQQDTTGVGEVTDIINALALRADGKDIWGPELIPYEELQALQQSNFAGDMVSGGYLPVWFNPGGRISNSLNPNSILNFRAVASVQASVTAGAGSSIIRVTTIELERVPGVTRDKLKYDI